MPCRFPGPHPRGKLRGIWSRSTAKGEVEGDLAGGCPLLGCLLQENACSGGVPAPGGACFGGCLLWRLPALGVCDCSWGGACSGGCGDPPPPMTVTAAGGTHPTGMLSIFRISLLPHLLSLRVDSLKEEKMGTT